MPKENESKHKEEQLLTEAACTVVIGTYISRYVVKTELQKQFLKKGVPGCFAAEAHASCMSGYAPEGRNSLNGIAEILNSSRHLGIVLASRNTEFGNTTFTTDSAESGGCLAVQLMLSLYVTEEDDIYKREAISATLQHFVPTKFNV